MWQSCHHIGSVYSWSRVPPSLHFVSLAVIELQGPWDRDIACAIKDDLDSDAGDMEVHMYCIIPTGCLIVCHVQVPKHMNQWNKDGYPKWTRMERQERRPAFSMDDIAEELHSIPELSSCPPTRSVRFQNAGAAVVMVSALQAPTSISLSN